MHANDDEFLAAIPPWFDPIGLDGGLTFEIIWPIALVDTRPPKTAGFCVCKPTRLRPDADRIETRCQPEQAFGAQHLAPILGHEIPQPLRVERSTGPIDEAPDTVFLGFGDMFPAELFEPSWCSCSCVEVEQSRIENRLHINRAPFCAHDACIWVQTHNGGFETTKFIGRCSIDFVDDDDIGKFDLVDEQVDDIPLILLVNSHSSCAQIIE